MRVFGKFTKSRVKIPTALPVVEVSSSCPRLREAMVIIVDLLYLQIVMMYRWARRLGRGGAVPSIRGRVVPCSRLSLVRLAMRIGWRNVAKGKGFISVEGKKSPKRPPHPHRPPQGWPTQTLIGTSTKIFSQFSPPPSRKSTPLGFAVRRPRLAPGVAAASGFVASFGFVDFVPGGSLGGCDAR